MGLIYASQKHCKGVWYRHHTSVITRVRIEVNITLHCFKRLKFHKPVMFDSQFELFILSSGLDATE